MVSASPHRLSRIEGFERDEIVRVLTQPGISMDSAAAELGMSRATLYRKVSFYGIKDIRKPRPQTPAQQGRSK
jgi:transcriptional regulator of acetoin/glycerol metabolism